MSNSNIKTKRISELPEGTTLDGFYTVGAKRTGAEWGSIRVNLGFVQEASDNAQEAADRLNTLCDNRDKVVNGYWWHYNETTKEYENTGEIAKGNVMYATFEIDDAAVLSMYTDEEYRGATITLDEEAGLLTLLL